MSRRASTRSLAAMALVLTGVLTAEQAYRAITWTTVVLMPIATPANMMVLGPGGYRFGDYWRLGLVMLGLFFAVAVGLALLSTVPGHRI